MELSGLVRADTAIVGNRLTGLLLASSLSHAGLDVVVLELSQPSCDTGLATLLDTTALARIAAIHGMEAARQHATALSTQLQALTDAPLSYVQTLPAYVYARHKRELPALQRQHALLTALGIPVQMAQDAGGCPFPVELSLLAQVQAVVDLPRWQRALRQEIRLRGSRVYPITRPISLDGRQLHTAQGHVEAPHIILTNDLVLLREWRHLALQEHRLIAHCPLTSLYPLHSCQLPVSQEGLTLIPAPGGALALWDAGPIGHREQQSSLSRFCPQLDTLLPDWQQGECHFSQSITTLDGLPVIGTMPGSGLLCASGLGRHGILGAMHAAEVLSRRILGHTRPTDALYAPDRRLPRACQKQINRRLAALHAANLLRRRAPFCAHCRSRMQYSPGLQRWECPLCGACCTILGQPLCGPGMQPVRVSPRQRPDV